MEGLLIISILSLWLIILMRKRALDNANFIVNQKLGDLHLTVDDLKQKLQEGDQSIAKKFFILVEH